MPRQLHALGVLITQQRFRERGLDRQVVLHDADVVSEHVLLSLALTEPCHDTLLGRWDHHALDPDHRLLLCRPGRGAVPQRRPPREIIDRTVARIARDFLCLCNHLRYKGSHAPFVPFLQLGIA